MAKGVYLMKGARLATKSEIDRIARDAQARGRGFSKTSETFAKGAKSRVAAFVKRTGAG